jgi:hypothetical protein
MYGKYLLQQLKLDNSNLSIADIMNQFGIINQGRFAQDYFKFLKNIPIKLMTGHYF